MIRYTEESDPLYWERILKKSQRRYLEASKDAEIAALKERVAELKGRIEAAEGILHRIAVVDSSHFSTVDEIAEDAELFLTPDTPPKPSGEEQANEDNS